MQNILAKFYGLSKDGYWEGYDLTGLTKVKCDWREHRQFHELREGATWEVIPLRIVGRTMFVRLGQPVLAKCIPIATKPRIRKEKKAKVEEPKKNNKKNNKPNKSKKKGK